MKLNRTRNKLKKNGFKPQDPVASAASNIRGPELWIDDDGGGTPISFFFKDDEVDGAFKVHGRHPDEPQFDYWASTFTRNLSEAIRLSRC